MKLDSNNIAITISEEMGECTIKQHGRNACFISYHNLEELRDLLNDYFEMQYGRGEPKGTSNVEAIAFYKLGFDAGRDGEEFDYHKVLKALERLEEIKF